MPVRPTDGHVYFRDSSLHTCRDSAIPMTSLDGQELIRYARQIRLPEIGIDGQTRLRQASVLIVGAGGLGSPAALYLAAAGVGRIGIADGDRVDATNLQRQILYSSKDVGVAKTDVAIDRLSSLNPTVRIEAFSQRVTSGNALELVESFDVVIDGTDNFPTRYLLSDACVLAGRPLIYGSVDRFAGQASVFVAEGAPCYRCLFPNPPEPGSVQNCAEAGVLGVLPGLIGTVQATEALKLLLGVGETLAGRLLMVDALRMDFRSIAVERDPECPACGRGEITELADYEAFCDPSRATTRAATDELDVDPRALARELSSGRAPVLIDVREPYEWSIGRLPSARLVPLNTLPSALGSIDLDADIVVYCHHGMRSEAAAQFLRRAGARHVRNLVGGIDRWSTDVDGSVDRY